MKLKRAYNRNQIYTPWGDLYCILCEGIVKQNSEIKFKRHFTVEMTVLNTRSKIYGFIFGAMNNRFKLEIKLLLDDVHRDSQW